MNREVNSIQLSGIQKTFYVPAGWSTPGGLEDSHIASFFPYKQRTRIAQIATEADYILCEDLAKLGDATAIGIFSDPRIELASDMHEIAANASGLQTPKRIPQTISPSNQPYPVVARYPLEVHGGRGVYFIETIEQMRRFQAGIVYDLFPEFQNDGLRSMSASDALNELVRRIGLGDIGDEMTTQINKTLTRYPLMEFIQSPSEYYTSFRVVADAHGNVHYGALTRSAYEKGKEIISRDEKQFMQKTLFIFEDPTSPVFLGSKKIVANDLSGGKLILLDGDPIIDATDAAVVKAHGIDPQNPTLPPELGKSAARIAVALRFMYPYVGVDFMKNAEDSSYVFLEENLKPIIYPEEIGEERQEGSRDDQREDCYFKMMQRVVSGPVSD